MRLVPLQTWLSPAAGPLLPQLRRQLAAAAAQEAGAGAWPLRWAITASDPARGLRIEAVLVAESPATECSGLTERAAAAASEPGALTGGGDAGSSRLRASALP